MSNYNLSRGSELFYKEIESIKDQYPRLKNTINFTASLFANKVGVMPEGNLTEINFTDEIELLFELNATPSYKKLANSILYSAQNCNETSVVSMLKHVVETYKNNLTPKKTSSEVDIEKNMEINNLIEENSQLNSNFTDTIRITDYDANGNELIKSFDVDNIDLIEDFDDEDLTVEGMRSTGMIDTNFDTLEGSEMKVAHRNKMLNGLLELMEDGSYTITCPYSGSRNVYQIDSSTYASFETDQPFKIVFNLADLKPD